VLTGTLPLFVTVTDNVGASGAETTPNATFVVLSDTAGLAVPVPLKFSVVEVPTAVTVIESAVVVVSVGA
jgi:hypothetical protein